MAKFYFWARLNIEEDYVEIPDSELAELNEDEEKQLILKYHDAWVRRQYYGDWSKG